MKKIESFTRRDFLKLGGWFLGMLGIATAISSCSEMESTEFEPYDLQDIERYITFPSSPFHHKELEPSGTTIEEFGNGKYRAISAHLGPNERLGLSNAMKDDAGIAAERAVYRTMDKYEKVMQIQEKIKIDGTDQYFWKTLNIAGSPRHTQIAKMIEGEAGTYLKPEHKISEESQAAASGWLHTAMYDSTLDPAMRTSILESIVLPEYQEKIKKVIETLKNENKTVDPIPESLPLELWADIHTALAAPPEPSPDEDWDAVLNAFSPAAGTDNCIFIPKSSPELQESIEHVTGKEFFDLPTKPSIYFVTHTSELGTITNTIYVTSDDQSKSNPYNHNFTSPYPEKEWISENENWEPLQYPGQAKNLTEIHGVDVNGMTQIYKLNEDQIGYFLIPNKFKGSPKLFKYEPNLRIAAGIKTLKNFEASSAPDDNHQIILFGKDVFDVVSAIHYQSLDWNNWLTDVTESCATHIANGVKKISKLGLTAPNEFFYKLFKTRKENLGLNLPHQSIVPEEPILEKVMLDCFISALQEDTDLHEFNWAFGTGSPVQIYELSGVKHARWQNKLGIKDTLTPTDMRNEKGLPVMLKPGEAMPFGEVIEDDKGEKWVLLARVQRDDTGAFYNNFVNKYFGDKINQSFAIKWEDAVKYICPLDQNNNILDASEKILKIGAVASTILFTLFAPEVLPAAALAGSLSISSKFNTLVSLLRSYGARTFSRFVP